MTKKEAIEALNRGEILTHTYMTDKEWVKKSKDNNYQYEFEDGVKQDSLQFWDIRQSMGWDIGWEIYKPFDITKQANIISAANTMFGNRLITPIDEFGLSDE